MTSRRKLVVPQKEASPFLDKKIEELELKLADMEEGDGEEMEEMDEEEEVSETPSTPQMQTPLASDMDMPYTPSQVPAQHLHAVTQHASSSFPSLKVLNTLIQVYIHSKSDLVFLPV